MNPTHRLHPVHTGRTESDAVVVLQARERRCSSCFEPLSQLEKPAYHCNTCDYTICGTCDRPKPHPVHPAHGVYYVTPTSQWRCDVCFRSCEEIREKKCYFCEQCDFYFCTRCYGSLNSPLHVHSLRRTDVRCVYHQSRGAWSCDACGHNNGPGH